MQEWERWERRVQTAAHPAVYRLVRLIAARGPVVRVPRVGVLVSDAGLAREVLTDTEGYTKTGPGAAAGLWSPVLGSRTLITLEGAEHAALRRRLGGLFTPGRVTAVCERCCAPRSKTWSGGCRRARRWIWSGSSGTGPPR